MFKKNVFLVFIAIVFGVIGCKQSQSDSVMLPTAPNQIQYAEGFEWFDYDDFSLVRITQPWPGATNATTFVFAENKTSIPDSLRQFTFVKTPVERVIVTSTTHLPSLVTLDELSTLKAFPDLDLVSSEEVRTLIEQGKIQEIGDGMGINFELTIDATPDAVIANGGTDSFDKYQQIEHAGIPVIYNGDWVEQTPLGKAEWIKLFGVLYGKENEAIHFFDKVAEAYEKTKISVRNIADKPIVFSGAMYEDVWYAPQGNSWTAQIIADAGGEYLWANRQGTGSLFLSFEQVLDDAQEAEFWIGPAQFTAYSQMENANVHYKEFESFQNKKVYTYSAKKGATGGVVFYEEATNRPDLLLKDYVKVLHPHLMPDHDLYFLSPLTE